MSPPEDDFIGAFAGGMILIGIAFLYVGLWDWIHDAYGLSDLNTAGLALITAGVVIGAIWIKLEEL